jgi:tetratricopeptide (TPR) repeat protein
MSILKQGGEGLSASPKKERSVRLADDAHHPSAHVSHEPASQSTSGNIGTDEMGSRNRSADAGRSVDLSATMSGISVNMENRDLKAEATQLVAFASSVQQQMDMFGDGQPQGGKIAVAYAQSCNALAKECLHDNMLRTSNELLEIAMHFLRTNHSMLVFLDHQGALAETHNNMGCLENKRGNLEVALKHILAAVEIETNLDWEVGHAATMLNACSTLSLLDRHAEALKAAQQAVDMLLAGEKEWDKLSAQPESTAGELLPVAFNNLALEFEFAGI